MLNKIWDQFLVLAKEDAGSRVVDTWLKAVSLYQWNSSTQTVYLLVPNAFVCDWIKSNYLNLLKTHLSRLLHVLDLKIIFLDAHNPQVKSAESIQVIPAQRIQATGTELVTQKSLKSRLTINKNYVFDTFVRGPNNQMAYAAALAITKKPGKLYNPLFIYGDSGLGKTHLLHAIANEIHNCHQKMEILYQPADRFVNEFIHAIRFDKMHKFQAKYKNVDVFLVDDIQSISNKEQTQEAFFHIFNALYDANKQIVFSSDSYPANINGLAERLRSRLECGLVTDIQAPSIETKIAIIKQKADFHVIEISDEVATYIASLVTSNIRELEGALIRIIAYSSLNNQQITLELVKKVFHRTPVEEQNIDIEKLLSFVAKKYNCTVVDLRSKNRSKEISLIRQIAMYLIKKMTNKSLQEIAVYLKRQDHTTVLHAFKQIEMRLKVDEQFARDVESLKRSFCNY